MPQNNISRRQAIDLFKSGNFTLCTFDNHEYSLYSQSYQHYEDIPEYPASTEITHISGIPVNDCEGYMPHIIEVMAEALGGKAHTI